MSIKSNPTRGLRLHQLTDHSGKHQLAFHPGGGPAKQIRKHLSKFSLQTSVNPLSIPEG